jgi:hypothetical protein
MPGCRGERGGERGHRVSYIVIQGDTGSYRGQQQARDCVSGRQRAWIAAGARGGHAARQHQHWQAFIFLPALSPTSAPPSAQQMRTRITWVELRGVIYLELRERSRWGGKKGPASQPANLATSERTGTTKTSCGEVWVCSFRVRKVYRTSCRLRP